MRLKGKKAVVTGAASGFGRGIAERFAAEGARVAILDINADAARQVARAIGQAAHAIACDVTQASQVNAAIAEADRQLGGIDIMVNNAGWSHRNRPMLDVTEAEFDKVYAVNVKSIFLSTQAVLPLMRRDKRGVILNISSTAGLRPRPGLSWYNSTKGAVNTLTKSMAVELAPEKIRVNAIAPVIGATGLLETFMGVPDTPEARAKFMASIPIGRFSTPADIAAGAVYLVSDEAEFITGVILEVDGGRCI
jgi:3-oxoacyl-[acyl-carrier protein] reductase